MTKAILLVEDEEHDVIFMRMALNSAGVSNEMLVARDGQQAINYVEGTGAYADRRINPIPGLILLDLKLPVVHGFDVLRKIRSLPATGSVPVIVLSSSNQDTDVATAYAEGANGYIVKPAYKELVRVADLLKKYWLDADGPPPDCREWEEIIEPRPE